ncbi:MAG: type II toxin-antitoxin system HicA family toxin [Planctomycetia bacterium]|nr:type II toxin-antitoxin system HicA family toxin [Planctomycetia bacterium]
MSKLPAVSGAAAVQAFSKAGFVVTRVTGSHYIMKRDGHRFILTVPVHSNRNLKPGTLRALIRAAGLSVDEFRQLLLRRALAGNVRARLGEDR